MEIFYIYVYIHIFEIFGVSGARFSLASIFGYSVSDIISMCSVGLVIFGLAYVAMPISPVKPALVILQASCNFNGEGGPFQMGFDNMNGERESVKDVGDLTYTQVGAIDHHTVLPA